MKKLPIVAVLLAAFSFSVDSKAGIIIEYYESGSDLVLEYSGSFDQALTAQRSQGTRNAFGNQVNSGNDWSVFYSTPALFGAVGTFDVVSASSNTFWGDGVTYDTDGNSSTGDTLMFRYQNTESSPRLAIWLDASLDGNTDYAAGQSIIGALTLGGESIASTGIKDWTVDIGSVGTIEIRARSFNGVPEPTSLAIFGTICLLGCGRRRMA